MAAQGLHKRKKWAQMVDIVVTKRRFSSTNQSGDAIKRQELEEFSLESIEYVLIPLAISVILLVIGIIKMYFHK